MAESIAFRSRELGELALTHKVDVDPRTGTLDVSVDVPLSPGRGGFGPGLSLQYRSTGPNSAFGLGWSLSGVPAIGVSLRDGLPRYAHDQAYVFGGQQLTRATEADGETPRGFSRDGFDVEVYRPTLNGHATRVERWIRGIDRDVHWRVHDRTGTVSVFGRHQDGRSRIRDPEAPGRVYRWLLESEYDKSGNAVLYDYAPEDLVGVDRSTSYERGVTPGGGSTQRYLRRIFYGNRSPLRPDDPLPAPDGWLLSVVFDYGERGESIRPPYFTAESWPARKDAFSTFRPGFEVRTYRLCRRILMFHHFPDELDEPATLVGELALRHRHDAGGATLEGIRYIGHRRDRGVEHRRSLPELSFNYTVAEPATAFSAAPAETEMNLPSGVNMSSHKFVDLEGDGLPGILFETSAGWYYKRNLGDGRFADQRLVGERPVAQPGRLSFSDFDGDGVLDLVAVRGREAGFHRYNRETGRWDGYQAFQSVPHTRSARLVDLNGDGRADLVDVLGDRLVVYRSEGRNGFGPPTETSRPRLDDGTNVPSVGPDPSLDLFFADMTGDGLPDQVRVRSGRVEYWPQIGHGEFSRAVVMEGAPLFDFAGEFDAGRVRLVDLDGSGTADLVYIGRGEIRYWINASGNRFVEGGVLRGLPVIDNLDVATVHDFLGDGTRCLLWSTTAPSGSGARLHHLQLTGPTRPRLLTTVRSGVGREHRIEYGFSTRHYLRDAGTDDAWSTTLPSHRTVVDRVEVIDGIGGSRSATRFEYRDGYHDAGARAFRGFLRADRVEDTFGDERTTASCIRSWFHPGVPQAAVSTLRKTYTGDVRAPAPLPSGPQPMPGSTSEEITEAYAALSGELLRTETYRVVPDGTVAAHPLTVMEARYQVRRIERQRPGNDASFSVYPKERLSVSYEEDPSDPRITQELTLAVDAFGNTTRSARVAYPRRPEREHEAAAQSEMRIEVVQALFLSRDEAQTFAPAIPLDNKHFELTGISPSSVGATDPLFGIDDFVEIGRVLDSAEFGAVAAGVLTFDQTATAGPQLRLVHWSRAYYWNDDQTAPAPWPAVGVSALVHHEEVAWAPVSLVEDAFGDDISASELREEGSYTLRDGYWWSAGPTLHFDTAVGFDLLSAESSVVWVSGRQETAEATYSYDRYGLHLEEAVDVVGNRVRAQHIDYQWLAPDRILDENDNVTEALYDPLGVLVVETEHGLMLDDAGLEVRHGNEPLADYEPMDATFDAVVAEPERFIQGMSAYVFYDLDTGTPEAPVPQRIVAVTRNQYVSDADFQSAAAGAVHVEVAYIDGFGRTLQARERAGAGAVDYTRGPSGSVVRTVGDEVVAPVRWRVSGHRVFNQKQLPIEEFSPFFSETHRYEDDPELLAFGVSTQTTYDAIGRAIEIKHPNGTRSRTSYGAWEQSGEDPNDTVRGSDYEADREDLPPGAPELIALEAARAHADTRTRQIFDPLGRAVVTIEDGGEAGLRRTETRLNFDGSAAEVIDPRRIQALTYRRDMLGRVLVSASVDAGEHRTVSGSSGEALRTWDSRGFHQSFEYDRARRPVASHLRTPSGHTRTTERLAYGDGPSVAQASLRNLRGRLLTHHDSAGLIRHERYSRDGDSLHSERFLATDYRSAPDWSDVDSVSLDESDRFTRRTAVDARGRIVAEALPDGTGRRYAYADGGGIARVTITSDDPELGEVTVLHDAEYNARGQRRLAELGGPDERNTILVQSEYDEQTGRMTRRWAHSTRAGQTYQDIQYTYDPVGNVLRTLDAAQPDGDGTFYRQIPEGIGSETRYTYDPLYRLVAATGRVHRASQSRDYAAPATVDVRRGTRRAGLEDLRQIRRYDRSYVYDISGNLRSMRHTTHGTGGVDGETATTYGRDYWVSGSSNRSLPVNDFDGDPITRRDERFDASGNCEYLPHLEAFEWDYRNKLARAVIVRRNPPRAPDDPEPAPPAERDDAEYYVYGGDGQRVRRVTERLQHGRIAIEEKIYLGDCEIKRVRVEGEEPTLERHTSTISDGNEVLARVHRWTRDDRGTESDDRAPRIHYVLGNHLGSASLEVADDGAVITYEEYFPYGETAFTASRSRRDVVVKDYRYCNKERDDVTGLYDYGFRYYAPWLGRWLSPDPAGPRDGPNLYLFVLNNPTTFTDPNGLQTRIHVPLDRLPNAGNAFTYVPWKSYEVAVVRDPEQRIEAGSSRTFVDPERFAAHQAALLERFGDDPPEIIILVYDPGIASLRDPSTPGDIEMRLPPTTPPAPINLQGGLQISPGAGGHASDPERLAQDLAGLDDDSDDPLAGILGELGGAGGGGEGQAGGGGEGEGGGGEANVGGGNHAGVGRPGGGGQARGNDGNEGDRGSQGGGRAHPGQSPGVGGRRQGLGSTGAGRGGGGSGSNIGAGGSGTGRGVGHTGAGTGAEDATGGGLGSRGREGAHGHRAGGSQEGGQPGGSPNGVAGGVVGGQPGGTGTVPTEATPGDPAQTRRSGGDPAGLEGSSGHGGFAPGSNRTGSRMGTENGSQQGSLLSGGESGTEPPDLGDDITNAVGILNLDFIGYDPNDPNARESGIPGGVLGILDFGETANQALYVGGTLLMAVLGGIGAGSAARPATRAAHQAGRGSRLLRRARRVVDRILELAPDVRRVRDWFLDLQYRMPDIRQGLLRLLRDEGGSANPLFFLEIGNIVPTIRRGVQERRFMQQMRNLIHSTPDHPLSFLLNSNGRWRGRTHLREMIDGVPSVQAGHGISRHGHADEVFGLQSAWLNQMDSWVGEHASRRAIMINDIVDIQGIPVHRATAEMWQNAHGFLPNIDLASLPSVAGWRLSP